MPNKKPQPRRKLRHADFAFDDTNVPPGRSRIVQLPIARLPSGTWSNMPVVVVHGIRPGPTIWLSGAIHGDELNGVIIIRRVLESLDPETLAGTVLAVPIVNVFGVTNGSRYLPDRRDLNRSFPGSSRGSLAARLAHTFFNKVVLRCEAGIDFHTASHGRDNLPQVRCSLDDPASTQLAHAFAPPLILDAKHRGGSLRAEADRHGIKVLLYEAGEAHRFSDDAIDLGVIGSLAVLHKLGMVAPAAHESPRATIVARSSRWMRAGRSGFARVLVALGDEVRAGDRVALITDSVERKRFVARARMDGVVISILRTALVNRGDALVHIASE